jgi:anti-sigma regulatory factor (Ser/Thr protein kinase)
MRTGVSEAMTHTTRESIAGDDPHTPAHGAVPVRAAEARGEVRALLAQLDPPADEMCVADTLLVTSELVTNALRHGGGLTSFRATVGEGTVVLQVGDHSTRVPSVTAREGASVGGYGWPLISRLCRYTRVVPTPTGKIIQVCLVLRRGAAR